jgi:hypothetical protein
MAIFVVESSFSENKPLRVRISSRGISFSGVAIKFIIIPKIVNSIKNSAKME